jgi:hypothetical protein
MTFEVLLIDELAIPHLIVGHTFANFRLKFFEVSVRKVNRPVGLLIFLGKKVNRTSVSISRAIEASAVSYYYITWCQDQNWRKCRSYQNWTTRRSFAITHVYTHAYRQLQYLNIGLASSFPMCSNFWAT